MDPVVVIGEELEAAGFGLAGVPVRTPLPAQLAAVFEEALAGAQLVVLSRRMADALGAERLRRAWLQATPLVAVLPELAAPQPDLAFVQRLRAVLGIDA